MTDSPTQAASPTWDSRSRDEAVTAAREVMTAFARPKLSQGEWWRDLAPMLSEGAREDYRYVAVENVPATKVRGKGKLVDDKSPYLAGVEISTDAGRYRVLLSRQDAEDPWRAERIEPERGS